MKDLQKLVGSLNKSGALSGFLGGVAGGGLTSLMGGKSKKSGKTALKYGALAAVGGLAWKAYKEYSQNNQQVQDKAAYDNAMQKRATGQFDFAPNHYAEQNFNEVIDDSNGDGQLLLMRAMIAAAYADGHIDEQERLNIFNRVETMSLTVHEKAMLFDELRKPLSLAQLIEAVPNAQTGIEVYAASASAIDLSQPSSQHYLQQLANQLCLPKALVESIHHQLNA